ncbi:hypothetical protein FJY63_06090, partial [Candidatus Sumerlaeota bacterium]|nr:hypothetical protein [Candidatus Sumerlaeota bacterium]
MERRDGRADHADLAGPVLEGALAGFAGCAKSFAPDGGSSEGPSCRARHPIGGFVAKYAVKQHMASIIKRGACMIQWFAAIAVFSIALAADAEASGPEAVIIENPTLRLVFDNQGKARSLLYKPTREELLAPRVRVPAFSLTQLRPYNAQLQLSLPAKTTVFPVVALRREADRLFADFGPVDLEAEICVRTTDAYIALTLEKV